MSDDNPHKLVARYRKARKLADGLWNMDVPTSDFENAPEFARKLAAHLAGTNVPSEVTWVLVVELIRERRGEPHDGPTPAPVPAGEHVRIVPSNA